MSRSDRWLMAYGVFMFVVLFGGALLIAWRNGVQ